MNQEKLEKIKTSAIAAIAGAVVTMIIGFAWGGWVLGSTALQSGEVMSRKAVIERLTPICVAQFNQDPEKDKKLVELRGVDYWKADQFVIDQGWATMPFENDPDNYVAEKCSAFILKKS